MSGVSLLPALRYPIFPPLAEVLNAAILTVAGDVATQITGWLAIAAGLGLVYTWARERSTPAGGWIAAATLSHCWRCLVLLRATPRSARATGPTPAGWRYRARWPARPPA